MEGLRTADVGGGRAALPSPRRSRHIEGKRDTVLWGGKPLTPEKSDEGFYRICGVKGAGKTHLTKLFVQEALREVETNPNAKLVVYEPKREFYAWICSMGLKSPVHYFMPSDKRSVALDFGKDFRGPQDSLSIAHAFSPVNPHDTQQFWGDATRTIYAAVYQAVHHHLGTCDLRLMCLVLEKEENVRCLLKSRPEFLSALSMLEDGKGRATETSRNIHITIQSRLMAMRIIAAHLDRAKRDQARRGKKPLSLRAFVKNENQGVLVISKDSTFKTTQDPMNGVLFLRLMELLDGEQADPTRKVFIVIDEFPTLAGDQPCPGIIDMFLRLRSRGVVILITYQAITSLKRIYGPEASETIGQCTNVIYLRQADLESAQYAAADLGHEWGTESKKSRTQGQQGSSRAQQEDWYDRAIYPPTELMNHLGPASKETGIEVRAKSPEYGKTPWGRTISPDFIRLEIEKPDPDIPQYEKRDWKAERLRNLTLKERMALGLPIALPRKSEAKACPSPDTILDN